MKGMFKLLGATVAVSLTIIVALLTFSIVRSFVHSPDSDAGKPHIAVIPINGMILSSQRIIKNIDEAARNPTTKSILIRMNTPGGLVAPSEEIYQAVKQANLLIPVYVSMGTVGASGGYYIAAGAKEIFANAGTLTASIGVIMEMVNVEQLMKWAKLQQITLKSGKMKDAGSMHRPMTLEERAFLDGILKNMHSQFRAAVKEGRKLNNEELDAIADGRVMTGEQAKNAKLVDHIATYQEAIKYIRTTVPGLSETSPVLIMDSGKSMIRKWIWGDDEDIDEEPKELLSLVNAFNIPLNSGYRFMAVAPIVYR